MTFFSDKNLYDVYFEGGLPSRAVPLKLSSRGLSANLSTADQNRIFNHIISLLEKVPDASTVELLLEPRHLLILLRAHGWSDEAIRRDLSAGGRPPGQLLLDVLARQVGIRGIFSDWPATVTYYANCLGL